MVLQARHVVASVRMAWRALGLPIFFLVCISMEPGEPRAEVAEVVFESDPVRPLARSPDGTRLFVANTPDGQLEIFAIGDAGLAHVASVPVGLEPVAVAARSNAEVWVVNHLSDSVSVVDVAESPPRVVRTLLVGDEPRDIVFAGPDRQRAFIATAHRGQNTPFALAAGTSGQGRADIWAFDAMNLGDSLGSDPLTIVTLFGDKPRALAVSPDGSTVYAAIFHSGNRTTTIPAEAVCNGGHAAPPCLVDGLTMPGGLPAPNQNLDGIAGPETGLIAEYHPATGAWQDELGRDWRNAARFTLPDLDVFVIDAMASPPEESGALSGAGTVLFGMDVNPIDGTVYVANTEARNLTRLESSVQGHLHEARITVVRGGAVTPRHLNKHIDYPTVPSATSVAAASLATPVALAISPDGATLYVAAFGSGKVGVLSTAALEADTFIPDPSAHIAVTGGGPSGLVLDEARGRLFVSTRFDNGVSTVDLATREEIAHRRLHDPEPPSVVAGRRFLYDATSTSSNGEASCAGCHVFADLDGLAWDLGRADLPVLPNPLVLRERSGRDDEEFHPLKGPMTTQTLRGLATHGSMHWRGDRSGGLEAGGDVGDERAAFAQFNQAFVSLLGRAEQLSSSEMDSFADFILAVTLPPNPHANLDGSLTPTQQAGRDAFFAKDCSACHVLDPSSGLFGTDGAAAVSALQPQFMKVPHLRNLYQKIGRGFGILFDPLVDAGSLGDQIRGFGFSHDGSAGRIDDGASDFLFVFPTNLAPIVGQQITLTAHETDLAGPRVDLLADRAAVGECDLVVKGVVAGEARGWLRAPDGNFMSDRAHEPPSSDAELRAHAAMAGQALTYSCVPPGTGPRRALDRDGDGTRDRDEIDAGSDPGDPSSTPASTEGESLVLYRGAVKPGAFFPLGPVALESGWGGQLVEVGKPFGLLLPAEANGAPVDELGMGRSAYRLRSAGRGVLRGVRILNHCGEKRVRLGAGWMLLVPASVSAADPVDAPAESAHALDHLACRTAALERRDEAGTPLPGLRRGIQLDLSDALHARRYELVALRRVCLPTTKEGMALRLAGPDVGASVQLAPATVRHPGLAYACYRVKLAERRIEQDGCGPAEEGDGGMAIHPPQARHAARSLALGDQLGVLRMESRAAREICLPSQVILPPA